MTRSPRRESPRDCSLPSKRPRARSCTRSPTGLGPIRPSDRLVWPRSGPSARAGSCCARTACGTTRRAPASSPGSSTRYPPAQPRPRSRGRSPTPPTTVAVRTTSPWSSWTSIHQQPEEHPMSTFTVDAYQNEYLPLGGSEVNAIVTVTSDGAAGLAGQPAAAEIVIVDTSGSMGAPKAKIKAAEEATAVAIDCIRDGVLFGVIAGSDMARLVYAPEQRLIAASSETRAAAKHAVGRLRAGGGTAMGSWLRRAGELFRAAPDRNCHAILL